MQIKSASQIFQSADKLETVALTKKLMSEEDWWLMMLYLKPSTECTKTSFTQRRAHRSYSQRLVCKFDVEYFGQSAAVGSQTPDKQESTLHHNNSIIRSVQTT